MLFIIEVCQYRRLLRYYICDNYRGHEFDDVASIYFELPPNIPLSSLIQSYKIKKHSNKQTVNTDNVHTKTSENPSILVDEYRHVPDSMSPPHTPNISKNHSVETRIKRSISNIRSHSIRSRHQTLYNYKQIAMDITDKFIKDIYGDLTVNISGEERERLCNIKFSECTHIELYYVFDEAFIQILRILKQPFQRFSRSRNYTKLLLKLSKSIGISIDDHNHHILSQFDNNNDSDHDHNDNDIDKAIHSMLYTISSCMNKHCLKCC